METVRETVLDDAKHAVCGDRDKQYGSPEDSFERIARFWSVYLHKDLSACDVANMMILFKVGRNITGEPKLDNWVDIAGYAACGADCQFPNLITDQKQEDDTRLKAETRSKFTIKQCKKGVVPTDNSDKNKIYSAD